MKKKIVFLPYDFDTAIGINNEGALVFSYNLEDIDQTEGGADVFNGQQSVLWKKPVISKSPAAVRAVAHTPSAALPPRAPKPSWTTSAPFWATSPVNNKKPPQNCVGYIVRF